MEDSQILNSSYKETLERDFQITNGKQYLKKLDVFSDIVKQYINETNLFYKNSTSGEINNPSDHIPSVLKPKNNYNQFRSEGFLDAHPSLQFPEFQLKFDLINAKKFSKRVQNWQGIVLEINESTFSARLIDLTNKGTHEIAEFEMDDISPEDLSLLSEGAIFYWSVGHYMENGQSVKRSDIRFQRLITLDTEDIEETKLNLERKYSNLKERKID